MINPKNINAITKCRPGCITKCRPGCNDSKLCSPCKNFRATFKVGQIITWGLCKYAYEIKKISISGPVVETPQEGPTTVLWSDSDLKKCATVGKL